MAQRKLFFKQKNQQRQIATLRAVLETLETYPDTLPVAVTREICQRIGVETGLVRRARKVAKERPQAVESILNEEVSLHSVYEGIMKGSRIRCTVCDGRGWIRQ